MQVSTQREIDAHVLSAVSEFVASLNSGSSIVADMSGLVEVTSRIPLSNLDYWERLIRSGLYQAAAQSKPAKWRFWRKPSPFLTWIDLCSGDGFKREHALRVLSGRAPNRFFFAMAVRRLNDWVPQVRSAAREQLTSIAVASNPEDVVDVLCAVLPHWNSWGRSEDEERQTLLTIASIEAVACVLKSRLISEAVGPLASVLTQLGQSSVLDAHLSQIASSAIQPSVRAKAYKSLLEGKATWVAGRKWEWTDIRYCKGHFMPIFGERLLTKNDLLEETLRAASSDRSAFVRRIAGDVLIRELGALGAVGSELATILESDGNPSVAEKGRFALKELSQKYSAA
ncbi:hypothetical protein DLM_3244 [Aquitalea magnusonii]|uniref:Uncharacterized protein n=1 Tax=Aquitalea magnusonii TaxID=332411 RepID=A0A3G9GPD4_9NEIS|nr:hypothetical protein [Aquitalea magnusonii]BBF86836.1 hypothetical protein DLM_3244 [Aquitalea magnusonii]